MAHLLDTTSASSNLTPLELMDGHAMWEVQLLQPGLLKQLFQSLPKDSRRVVINIDVLLRIATQYEIMCERKAFQISFDVLVEVYLDAVDDQEKWKFVQKMMSICMQQNVDQGVKTLLYKWILKLLGPLSSNSRHLDFSFLKFYNKLLKLVDYDWQIIDKKKLQAITSLDVHLLLQDLYFHSLERCETNEKDKETQLQSSAILERIFASE